MYSIKDSDERKTTLKSLNTILKNKSLSNIIENSILNYAISFCKDNNIDDDMCEYTYQEKSIQILDVIKIDINLFKKNIKDKKIIPEEIAFLSPQELDPKKWEQLLKKREKNRKNLQNANITEEYVCSKCGNNKHTVVSLQTRSADEPITHFITCTNCGHTFKQ